MESTDLRVSSFTELSQVLERYRRDNRWIFRGHSDPTWKLAPRAGRPPYQGANDRLAFEAWKRRALEFVSQPPADDWGWLAMAQHHGLASRLLDWTYYPLVAAFFAVETAADSDAAIHVFRPRFQANPDGIHPMDYPHVALFKPMGVVPRITRQGGIFSIHPEPAVSLYDLTDDRGALERVLIAQSYRDELVFELSYYGVNRSTLFPDLDGLSSHVNWATANRSYWAFAATPSEGV